MTPQKLVVLTTSLAGGAIGLFAPVGVVKWILQTEPADAGFRATVSLSSTSII
jgi:hypothetical protein